MIFRNQRACTTLRWSDVTASRSHSSGPPGCIPAQIVTYRGTTVGRVEKVRLTDTGVEAVLSLKSNIEIPAQLGQKSIASPQS